MDGKLRAGAEAKAAATRKAEEEEREKAAELRRARVRQLIGTPPAYNAADGSVACVVAFMQEYANDPRSVQYTHWQSPRPMTYKGIVLWAVPVVVRATNGFGGLIRSEKVFLIAHDKVVACVEADDEKLKPYRENEESAEPGE